MQIRIIASLGAHTWEILTSLAATCTQQAESFSHFVSQPALLSVAPSTHTRPPSAKAGQNQNENITSINGSN